MTDEWRESAACKGQTRLFFSAHVCTEHCPPLTPKRQTCPHLDGRQTGNLSRERRAKAMCLTQCTVLDECREWITTQPHECKHGVVAGMSESERRRLNWASTKTKQGDHGSQAQ